MIRIRSMTPDDVDAVRLLDVEAFLPYMQKTGRGNAMPPRTRDNVLACLALNPSGCFVAEDRGEIIGYIFSRVWGAVGWIGVFGIHPAQQHKGTGGQLLARASTSLKAAGCATIGLETMPDWPANVGFYAQWGFRPSSCVVTVIREVGEARTCPPYTLLSRLESVAALGAVSELSHAAVPGLDYGPESKNAAEFGWGDTLLIGWPEPWAAVVVRLAAKREGDEEPVADAAAIVGSPQSRTRLPEILAALEKFCAERRLGWIVVRVNTADWQTFKGLLDDGFSASHVALRMVLRGSDACPAGLDLSRWAM